MVASKEEVLILVDKHNCKTGTERKLKVHRDGLLHRAFSIFVFNTHGQLMLQQRAQGKYHSGGLWTNTCCGHPRPKEPTLAAAHRRLQEEMGFDCTLRKVGTLIYRAQVSEMLIEHEFDYVYVGRFDGHVQPDSKEVQDWKWIDPSMLATLLITQPALYTVWFKKILEQPTAQLESLKIQALHLKTNN